MMHRLVLLCRLWTVLEQSRGLTKSRRMSGGAVVDLILRIASSWSRELYALVASLKETKLK